MLLLKESLKISLYDCRCERPASVVDVHNLDRPLVDVFRARIAAFILPREGWVA